MKAFLTAIFCTFSLLFCITTELLSADNQLITELKVLDNDSSFRYLYIYDNNNHKVLETNYIKRSSLWVRYSQTEWLYDGDNCTDQIERVWLNNAWKVQKTIKFEITNNILTSELHTSYPNGNPLYEKKTSYDYVGTNLMAKTEFSWTNTNWEMTQKIRFTYTSDNKTDSVITLAYDNSIPSQFYLMLNGYSATNLLTSQLFKTRTISTDWVNSELTSWYYKPGTSNTETQIMKRWNSDILNWENVQRIDYDYGTAGELLSEQYQNWQLVYWADDIRYDYLYETPTKLLKKTVSFPLYHHWRSLVSIQYSDFFAEKPNTMESKFEFWGGPTGELTTSYIPFQFNDQITIEKAKRIEISYLPVTDLESGLILINANSHLINVYPNPSQGMFYVDTQKYSIRSWVVSDVDGKVLKKQEQTFQSGVIDLTDLHKGVYLLKVFTSDGIYNQKLIKN